MTRRIGILGGTFDPIHCGHLDLGAAAVHHIALTSLMVMPANVPPHRPPPTASRYHRFAMVALAVAGRERWQASDLELERDAPSYTSTTLHRLHARNYRPAELFFVLGADAFADIESWKDYPAILDGAHFAVVSRPGFPVDELPTRLPGLSSRMVKAAPGHHVSPATPSIFLINAPTADVSATAIRRRCAEGQSIAGLVAPGVEQHIEQHGLYRSQASDMTAPDALTTPTAGRLHGQD